MNDRDTLKACAEHVRQSAIYKGYLKQNGRRLLQITMKNSRLSLRKFAGELGLTPGYICHVLKGHGEVSIELAATLWDYILSQVESNQ